MDAMDDDEFQEADILWPDPEDELLAPFAPMDMEELAGSVSSVAPPEFGRRFEGFFLSGGAGPSPSSFSAGAMSQPDAGDDGEWQEADVLWPDTADDEPRESAGLMWPFSGGASGGSGRAGRRDGGWTTGPAASSPINIPANDVVAPRYVVGLGRR